MTPKINRTPKEWTEPCGQCHGTGVVHKRQFFALWTPDEYEHVEPLHDAPPDAYVCTTAPGASIGEAVREGIEIAQTINRPVAFEFNGTMAIVQADSDLDTVYRDWWKRAYGETYEESLAKR